MSEVVPRKFLEFQELILVVIHEAMWKKLPERVRRELNGKIIIHDHSFYTYRVPLFKEVCKRLGLYQSTIRVDTGVLKTVSEELHNFISRVKADYLDWKKLECVSGLDTGELEDRASYDMPHLINKFIRCGDPQENLLILKEVYTIRLAFLKVLKR